MKKRRNQQGKGLKILTPNQMLGRLPISLAQLNAENNSERRNQTTILFFVQMKQSCKTTL